jgi:amidohydrolase
MGHSIAIVEEIKAAVRREIEIHAPELIDLSHRIHGTPELGWEERQSSAWVADSLEASGFEVERGVCDLPTALAARIGEGELHVGICAEYDALPGVGHACGHNVIAAAAVGAGLGLARRTQELGLTVTVLGTPAEEEGAGKILMLERQGFSGIHAAMMVHPAPFETEAPVTLALAQLMVEYTGKEAHASAAPHLGINAADALTVAQVGIGLLRQHILPTDRIHGIVTKGGDAPNVVPADTTAEYYVRARAVERLWELKERVVKCFQAGALATGATLVLHDQPEHANVHTDPRIARLYRRNAERLGRTFTDDQKLVEEFAGSTDFGNVSMIIPSIHPFLGIEASGSVNHQPEFAAACLTESADRAVIEGAVAMAWTAIDLATEASVRQDLVSGNRPTLDSLLD